MIVGLLVWKRYGSDGPNQDAPARMADGSRGEEDKSLLASESG